jgi:glycosyltransferase involved in cell wall biosynthesis
MSPEFLFTVFTPTFNREHTLQRVYDSLCAQVFRDFEWLVVDDGSTDGTSALIEAWTKSAFFPIRFVRQQNQGKHVAHNRGVLLARGQLFLSLDSDDACTPEALERFRWHWEQIPPGRRDSFTGVTALCADQFGHLHGSRFPSDVFDSDSLESRFRYKVTGEKWGFHRTEVLRRYPFPEVPGARHVPENIVWFQIARAYKTRYVNEVLRTYWTSPVQGAQLTSTGLTRPQAVGLALLCRSLLNDHMRWCRYAPLRFARSSLNYSRFSFDSGAGVAEQRRHLGGLAQCLWLASLPFGFAASLRDRTRSPALR